MNNMPVPADTIRQAIMLLRGQKVIPDRDLAAFNRSFQVSGGPSLPAQASLKEASLKG